MNRMHEIAREIKNVEMDIVDPKQKELDSCRKCKKLVDVNSRHLASPYYDYGFVCDSCDDDLFDENMEFCSLVPYEDFVEIVNSEECTTAPAMMRIVAKSFVSNFVIVDHQLYRYFL
jgi:hypothetical protein